MCTNVQLLTFMIAVCLSNKDALQSAVMQGFIQWGGGGGGGGGGGWGEASPPNSLASPTKNLILIKLSITVSQ